MTVRHNLTDGRLRLAATGEVDMATGELLADAISRAVTSGNHAHLEQPHPAARWPDRAWDKN